MSVTGLLPRSRHSSHFPYFPSFSPGAWRHPPSVTLKKETEVRTARAGEPEVAGYLSVAEAEVCKIAAARRGPDFPWRTYIVHMRCRNASEAHTRSARLRCSLRPLPR
jgi:hypothetical protein